MIPDPFRIQVLTLTLDSEAVLLIAGLAVAGVVFRLAARRAGLDLRIGDWWDVVVAAVVGARLLWVVTHADYYLRGPLQVVVITDGGLHPLGLVLGAAYALRGLRRRAAGASWRSLVDLIALAALATFLAERAGCALTTCGGGAPTDLPWALRRGEEWRQPLALYQVAILSAALLLAVRPRGPVGSTFAIGLVAFGLVELVAPLAGGGPPAGLLAVGAAAALYLLAARREAWPPRRLGPVAPSMPPGAGKLPARPARGDRARP